MPIIGSYFRLLSGEISFVRGIDHCNSIIQPPPWFFKKKVSFHQVAICQTGRRRDKHIHVGRLSLQRTTSGTMKSSPSIALYRSCQGEEEQRFLQFAWGSLYKWPCFKRVTEVISYKPYKRSYKRIYSW